MKICTEVCRGITNSMAKILKLCHICLLSLPFITEILVPPESVNVIAGDTVVFHCVARAEELDWLVNRTRAAETTIIDKGFMQGGIDDISETTRERKLTAIALTNLTNTNITCRALNTVNDFGIIFSEPAVLLVQGNNITRSNCIVYIHVHICV